MLTNGSVLLVIRSVTCTCIQITIDRGSLNLSFLSIIIVESFTIHCMQERQNMIGLEVGGGGVGEVLPLYSMYTYFVDKE